MSRLTKEIVIQTLQEYDEAMQNDYFNPYSFYQTIIICSILLQLPIPQKKAKNNLYKKYRKAISECNPTEIRKIQSILKNIIDHDRPIIDQYIEQETQINYDDQLVTQLWNKKSIGALSYVYEY